MKNMAPKAWLAMLASLVAGFVFDYFFYQHPFGISVPLFVMLSYLTFFICVRPPFMVSRLTWLQGVLSVFVAAFSLSFLWMSDPVVTALNVLLLPFLVFIHQLLLADHLRREWGTSGFMGEVALQAGTALVHIPNALKDAFTLFKKAEEQPKGLWRQVFIGLAIAVPLVIIIILLLTSADMVFSKMIGDVGQQIRDFLAGDFVVHLCVIVMVAALAAGTLSSLRSPYAGMHLDDPREPKRYPNVTLLISLALTTFIYVVFVILQFRLLFGGVSVVEQFGFTYSQYAVRGFWELMTVGVINIILVLVTMMFADNLRSKSGAFLRGLLLVMIAATLVILYSAHFRLSLYESVYGFTHLRVFAHAGIVLLGMLLVFSIAKVFREKIRFAKGVIFCGLFVYCVLNFAGVERMIINGNLENYQRTGRFDYEYLNELSFDAYPALKASGLRSPEVEAFESRLRQRLAEQHEEWFTWNYARATAREMLR